MLGRAVELGWEGEEGCQSELDYCDEETLNVPCSLVLVVVVVVIIGECGFWTEMVQTRCDIPVLG